METRWRLGKLSVKAARNFALTIQVLKSNGRQNIEKNGVTEKYSSTKPKPVTPRVYTPRLQYAQIQWLPCSWAWLQLQRTKSNMFNHMLSYIMVKSMKIIKNYSKKTLEDNVVFTCWVLAMECKMLLVEKIRYIQYDLQKKSVIRTQTFLHRGARNSLTAMAFCAYERGDIQ